MSNGADIKPTDLRGILKYVPRFQGQTFVISADGIIVADENFANILTDIAVLRSLGIKIILVHGIGHCIIQVFGLSRFCFGASLLSFFCPLSASSNGR